MDARVYAQGLRDFADFVECHPPIVPSVSGGNQLYLKYCLTREEFEQAHAALGHELPVEVGDKWAEVHRRFGPISVQVYVDREKVCEPVETVTTAWRYQPAAESEPESGTFVVDLSPEPEPESGMPDGYVDGTTVYSEHDRRL